MMRGYQLYSRRFYAFNRRGRCRYRLHRRHARRAARIGENFIWRFNIAIQVRFLDTASFSARMR